MFGKPPGEPAVVKQEPQSQTRSLFGKGPPDYQEVVTVKQEKPRHAALFGKPAPTSEPEGGRKAGLFGKGGGGGSSGHQAVEGRSYHLSQSVRKPVLGVSDKVQHKQGCIATEDG